MAAGTKNGPLIRPSACLLQIEEYYENWRYINRYFTGRIIGNTAIRLTAREREAGMEPRWLPVSEILEIFSRHSDFEDTDEMRCGMYLREYTALCEIIRQQASARH